MSQRETVYECPAFTAYDSTPDYTGYFKLTDGMQLACKMGKRSPYSRFVAGALRLDDLKPGQTYEEYVAREEAKHGGKRHWINANCTILSSSPMAKEQCFAIEIGQVVLFQGVVYKIARANNDNLALVPQ